MMVILRSNVVLNGTGSHDAGNAAARADQHGDEALAGQAELTEDTVHDKGDTSHVANVFEDGQQEEQHDHLRHEAQHRANAADDAVRPPDRSASPPYRRFPASRRTCSWHALSQQNTSFVTVGHDRTDGGHGDVIHEHT